jgi:hypothetical protein
MNQSLEFKVKTHFGRKDFYPVNEAARLVLEFKIMVARKDMGAVKCFKKEELEKLKVLGFEIKIIQDLGAV